jgi:hypothetical protein
VVEIEVGRGGSQKFGERGWQGRGKVELETVELLAKTLSLIGALF